MVSPCSAFSASSTNGTQLVSSGFSLSQALATPDAIVHSSTFYNTTSGNVPVVIQVAGGSFADNKTGIRNLARYDPSSGQWTGFSGHDFDSEVRAVQSVDDANVVYIGGAFQGALAAWNFQTGSFDTSFATASGSGNVSANAIAVKADSTQVVFGGSFSRVGSTDCLSVCAWDYKARAWKGLGTGVAGVVRDMSVLGDQLAVIGDGIGSAGSNGGGACFGVYSFKSNDWKFIGTPSDCPSPPSSVSVDPFGNTIVVGGTSSSGASFILQWDGSKLASLGQGLGSSSTISGVSVVPVTIHGPSGGGSVFSQGSMLLASGNIVIPIAKAQSASSTPSQAVDAALFDGAQWYPYVRIAPNSPGGGGLGKVQIRSFLSLPSTKLPVPLVVLVAAAISIGVIVIIAAIIFFVVRRRRRRREKNAVPPLFEKSGYPSSPALPPMAAPVPVRSRGHDMIAHPVIPVTGASPPISPGPISSPKSVVSSDLEYAPVPLMQAMDAQFQLADYEVYYARFPFSAGETGELEFSTGDKIYVLDNSDEVWWLGLVENGQNVPPSQGVFPASYVSKDPPPRWTS